MRTWLCHPVYANVDLLMIYPTVPVPREVATFDIDRTRYKVLGERPIPRDGATVLQKRAK
jgi:hypothetical protein